MRAAFAMKPNPHTAMRILIGQVRDAIPFDMPQAQICTGTCEGCALKLLTYLDTELADWERRLDDGEQPRLGDVSALAKTSRKIYAVLERNGLLGQQARDA